MPNCAAVPPGTPAPRRFRGSGSPAPPARPCSPAISSAHPGFPPTEIHCFQMSLNISSPHTAAALSAHSAHPLHTDSSRSPVLSPESGTPWTALSGPAPFDIQPVRKEYTPQVIRISANSCFSSPISAGSSKRRPPPRADTGSAPCRGSRESVFR